MKIAIVVNDEDSFTIQVSEDIYSILMGTAAIKIALDLALAQASSNGEGLSKVWSVLGQMIEDEVPSIVVREE